LNNAYLAALATFTTYL